MVALIYISLKLSDPEHLPMSPLAILVFFGTCSLGHIVFVEVWLTQKRAQA